METAILKKMLVVLIATLTFGLTSCSGMNKSQMGAAGGAAGGALIGQAAGNNTEYTLIGAAIGAVLGYMVGNEMDKYDQQMLANVYEGGTAGRTTGWTNNRSGVHYEATPERKYSQHRDVQVPPQYGGGMEREYRDCRRGKITATIDGKSETVHQVMCKNRFGEWVFEK